MAFRSASVLTKNEIKTEAELAAHVIEAAKR